MQDEVRGEFTISSDADLLNFEMICELLRGEIKTAKYGENAKR